MLTSIDWKDASNYPPPGKESISNARFAWEFLRRNRDYRAAWSDYVAVLTAGASNSSDLLDYVACLTANSKSIKCLCSPFVKVVDTEPDGWVCIYPQRKSVGLVVNLSDDSIIFDGDFLTNFEETITWSLERQAFLNYRHNVNRSFSEQWNILAMANPDDRFGARFLNSFPVVNITTGAFGGSTLPSESKDFPLEAKWLVLKIDLSQPLGAIQDAVMRIVKLERDIRTDHSAIKLIETRVQAPKLLVHYLQVLDASAQGVHPKIIGEVLKPRAPNHAPQYGRDKLIKVAIRAAESLRDGGYRSLSGCGSK